MNRSETRQVAFELIYSLEVQKLEIQEYEEQVKNFLVSKEIQDKKVEEYINDIAYGIEKEEKEIVQLIDKGLSEKWQINRIPRINIAILKLAIYELLYKELPYKVVVNEAVELAKKFGDDNAPSFINGILASIIKEKGISNT